MASRSARSGIDASPRPSHRTSPTCERTDGNLATMLLDPNSSPKFTPMHKRLPRSRADGSPAPVAKVCRGCTINSRDPTLDEAKGATTLAFPRRAPTVGPHLYRSDRRRQVISATLAKSAIRRPTTSRLARKARLQTEQRQPRSSLDQQPPPTPSPCSMQPATQHLSRLVNDQRSFSSHGQCRSRAKRTLSRRKVTSKRKRRMRMTTTARLTRMRRVCLGQRVNDGLATVSRR